MLALPIDINQYRWIIPLTLLLVALLQLLYLAVLSRIPKEREPRQASAPVYPPVREYTPLPVDVRQQPPTAPIPAPPTPTPARQPVATKAPTPAPTAPPPPAPSGSTYAPASAPSGGGVGKFVVLSGIEGMSELALPAKEFAIGRFYSPENDILMGIDEKSISRKHARFIGDESVREYFIKDTSSSFGTFILINGQFEQLPANSQERIYNEDVIRFGNVATVRVLIPCETRGAVTML